MTSTMYLANAKEIAAAARAARAIGYQTTIADIRDHDRYVINIVARLAGAHRGDQRTLENAIVDAVHAVRSAE